MKKIIFIYLIAILLFGCSNYIVKEEKENEEPPYVPFVATSGVINYNAVVLTVVQPKTDRPATQVLDVSSVTGGQAFIKLSISDDSGIYLFCNYGLEGIDNADGKTLIGYSSATDLGYVTDGFGNKVDYILTNKLGQITLRGCSTVLDITYTVTLIDYQK